MFSIPLTQIHACPDPEVGGDRCLSSPFGIPTRLCHLEPVREQDREDVRGLYADETVRRFLGGAVTGGAFDGRFDRMLGSRSGVTWVARLYEEGSAELPEGPGAFVGLISIDAYHGTEEYEVSYQLCPRFWGYGLAAELVGAVILYARDVMRLPAVVAETQRRNARSVRLLERLGMAPARTLTRFGEEQVVYRCDFVPREGEPK